MDSPQEQMITIMHAGPLGEPDVVRAFLGEDVDVRRVVLKDYGVRLQPLEAVQPQFVQTDLCRNWNERGMPFYGAFTLVEAPGEIAEVNMFSVSVSEWKKMLKTEMYSFWNYHPAFERKDGTGWFRFKVIRAGDTEGNIHVALTEVIDSPSDTFREVSPNYREEAAYQAFVVVMAKGARVHRAKVEGQTSGREIVLGFQPRTIKSFGNS